jgi:glycine/D-amino acid oxidase-like deaminating enzyme
MRRAPRTVSHNPTLTGGFKAMAAKARDPVAAGGGITRKRKLRSGLSVWQGRRRARLPLSELPPNATADVLVVGAGISGALIAEAVAAQGLSVLVVDRRAPLEGSTPASTALLQYEIDTPLTKLSSRIGKARAQRVWRRSKLALDALRERTRWLGIAADAENRDSLYLAGNVLDADALKHEVAERRIAGFETQYLDQATVEKRYGIVGRAALLGFDNLAADPIRLAAGFLSIAASRGVRLVADFEAAAIEARRNSVKVTAKDGRVVVAGSVVFATGYEFLKGIPLKGHSIGTTWAFATRPQPRNLWNGRCFIWEASDPYLYLRAGPGGSVVCGGEDEDFADPAQREKAKIAELRRKLEVLMPRLETEPAYVWSGNFGKSRTGTPTIGSIPNMANCYAVMGYGGNGITFSMLAAQMMATALTGARDPDSDLFSFSRAF